MTQLHPLAFDAALAAEASAAKNRFWAMHNFLLVSDIRSGSVAREAERLKINRTEFSHIMNTEALAKVKTDLRLAAELGLDSTPSYVLCQANGNVVALKKLEDVALYLGRR